MIKVIELSPTMGNGGAETLIKDYALYSNRDLIDMRVVTWCGTLGSANEEHLKSAGIPVVHLEELHYGPGRRLNALQRIVRKICRFIDFRRYVITEKPDVIHIHLRFGGYMRVLPLRKLGVKLFYTVHNELEQYFDKKPAGKKYLEYLEAKRLVNRYGMTMITLHNDMNKSIREFFNTDRVITVNNGINLDRFRKNLYDRGDIRDSLGIDRNAFVIGHVGSVHTQKNHEMIIDVYEEYLKRDSLARLLLIGKGNRKEYIKQYIADKGLADRVVFLEDRTDIPALMCAMDIFIMPSRWEGYPVVLIEAQSIGLPCVISDRITAESVLTDRVKMMSIDDSPKNWCDCVDGFRYEDASFLQTHTKPYGALSDYDIHESIKKLEKLYADA